MTLRDSIKDNAQDLKGSVKITYLDNKRTFQEFLDRGKITNDPYAYYKEYFGKCGKFKDMNKTLVSEFPLEVHNGFNKTNTFFMSSAKDFVMADYISQQYNMYFRAGKTFLPYDAQSAYHIVCMQTSMILAKYDIKTLTEEHILFTVIYTLFAYFKAYDKKRMLIDIDMIRTIYNNVLDLDIEKYSNQAKLCGFDYDPNIDRKRGPNKKRPKPSNVEQLIECFSKTSVTQTDKVRDIMKWWRVKERTAWTWMKDFGLTNHQNNINDVIDVVNIAADELTEKLDIVIENQEFSDEKDKNILDKLEEFREDVFKRFDDIAKMIEANNINIRRG